MAYKSKGTSISFRLEDDVAEVVQKAADREDLTLADFVRKVFRYGFHRYTLSEHGLFPLLQEEREETLRRREAAELSALDARVSKRLDAAAAPAVRSPRKVAKAS
jgi:uncharacterized protein (DUF1778 family)